MRVFVAVDVPSRVAAAVERAVAPVRARYDDCKWTRSAAWHVTLAFLGEIDEEAVGQVADAVTAAVEETGIGPIRLELGPVGTFGRRVLWLAIDADPEGALARLGSAIQDHIVSTGLPCDEKDVHPHLTLARSRGRGRLPRGVVEEIPTVAAGWTATEVEVLRSHLGDGPARYETLAAVPLPDRRR